MHLLSLKMRRRCLIEWFVALALWFGFAFSLSVAELLVGAACAVLTVVTLEVVFGAEPLCFAPSRSMLAEVRLVPLLIIKGLGALLSVLATRIRGGRSQSAFRVVAFRPGGSSAQQAAQRVLVVSFTTTPPNSIVVGIDRDRQQMLLHQIKRGPLPEIIRYLEASE